MLKKASGRNMYMLGMLLHPHKFFTENKVPAWKGLLVAITLLLVLSGIITALASFSGIALPDVAFHAALLVTSFLLIIIGGGIIINYGAKAWGGKSSLNYNLGALALCSAVIDFITIAASIILTYAVGSKGYTAWLFYYPQTDIAGALLSLIFIFIDIVWVIFTAAVALSAISKIRMLKSIILLIVANIVMQIIVYFVYAPYIVKI